MTKQGGRRFLLFVVTSCIIQTFACDTSLSTPEYQSYGEFSTTTVDPTFQTGNLTMTIDPPRVINAKDLYRSWYLPVYVWHILCLLPIVPGKVLVIIAFIQTPSLRTPINIFILNLCLCDIMTFLSGIYLTTLSYTPAGLKFAFNAKYSCLLSLSAGMVSIVTSLSGILVLSIERIIAVYASLRYYEFVTENNAIKVCVCIWSLSIGLYSIPLTGWNLWQPGVACFSFLVHPPAFVAYAFIMVAMIMMIMSFLLHLSICVVAWKKYLYPRIIPANANNTTARVSTHHEFKITKMFFKIVGTFYFCWVPFLICTCLHLTSARPGLILSIVHAISLGFLPLNAALNPLIYAKHNQGYRNAIKKILHMK